MRSFVVASCTLAAATIAACSSSTPGTSLPPSSKAPDVATAARSVRQALPIRQVTRTANPYTLFETLQVRPLALSTDGQLLFAANTPDNRLEIFHVRRDGLDKVASVEVGLEPIAVAVRSRNEVWVVNHLSDSVSVVNVERSVQPAS